MLFIFIKFCLLSTTLLLFYTLFDRPVMLVLTVILLYIYMGKLKEASFCTICYICTEPVFRFPIKIFEIQIWNSDLWAGNV